jgi:hypothetical protein
MGAIVIEIPASRLRADSALNILSELRFKPNAPTLGDSAQLLRCLRNPATAEADLEKHCLSLLAVFNRDREEASTRDGVERVRTLLDECCTEKHSLAELGKMAGLHPAYLVNAFRSALDAAWGSTDGVGALHLP